MMIPQPLHPAVVHFPIVLVVLLPVVALVALMVARRGVSPRRSWLVVVAFATALTGSSWVALRTGEAEEEAVEEVVSEAVIHEHEEAAELFLPLTAAVLLLAAAGLVKGRVGAYARPLTLGAALLLLVAGYRVGHTGGELVYGHGAAQAYVTASGGRLGIPGEAERRGEERQEEGRQEHEGR